MELSLRLPLEREDVFADLAHQGGLRFARDDRFREVGERGDGSMIELREGELTDDLFRKRLGLRCAVEEKVRLDELETRDARFLVHSMPQEFAANGK